MTNVSLLVSMRSELELKRRSTYIKKGTLWTSLEFSIIVKLEVNSSSGLLFNSRTHVVDDCCFRHVDKWPHQQKFESIKSVFIATGELSVCVCVCLCAIRVCVCVQSVCVFVADFPP